MALKTMEAVTLEVQSAWGKMVVGPILDRDIPLRPEDRVCRVPQGIFYGSMSIPESEDEETDVTSNSESPLNGEVKGSSFYFGTAAVVMERDEKSVKCWVRQGSTVRDEVGWLKYERLQD